MYEERAYRNWVSSPDIAKFEVISKETDLLIQAETDLTDQATKIVEKLRSQIEEYIKKDPDFQTSLKPYKVAAQAPLIVKDMAKFTSLVDVGPFASVAGAIAEYTGNTLLKYSKQIIVENGGDIFIKSSKDRSIGVFAGSSSFNKKIALKIKAADTPIGVCTSSGTIGHSLSFGRADAVTVISKSTLLADAAATRIGNIVSEKEDISKAIKFAKTIKGLKGVVIIQDENMGAWGDVEISKI